MSSEVGTALFEGLASAWTSRLDEHRPMPVKIEANADALPRPREAHAPAPLTAFLAGEREAFDVIVERHRRLVYQLCYRFLNNPEDAADMTQDVFVRAFKGLRNFKGDAALGTWLYRVGVNACLNRVALKRPSMEALDVERHVDERRPNAHELVAQGERAVVVRRAIAQLPPKQRATLVLRMYQEMSHEEIAGVLGTSVGAVKANFFHALGNLKRLLEKSS